MMLLCEGGEPRYVPQKPDKFEDNARLIQAARILTGCTQAEAGGGRGQLDRLTGRLQRRISVESLLCRTRFNTQISAVVQKTISMPCPPHAFHGKNKEIAIVTICNNWSLALLLSPGFLSLPLQGRLPLV